MISVRIKNDKLTVRLGEATTELVVDNSLSDDVDRLVRTLRGRQEELRAKRRRELLKEIRNVVRGSCRNS